MDSPIEKPVATPPKSTPHATIKRLKDSTAVVASRLLRSAIPAYRCVGAVMNATCNTFLSVFNTATETSNLTTDPTLAAVDTTAFVDPYAVHSLPQDMSEDQFIEHLDSVPQTKLVYNGVFRAHQKLHQFVHDSEHHALLVQGAAGSGKSTCVIHECADLINAFDLNWKGPGKVVPLFLRMSEHSVSELAASAVDGGRGFLSRCLEGLCKDDLDAVDALRTDPGAKILVIMDAIDETPGGVSGGNLFTAIGSRSLFDCVVGVGDGAWSRDQVKLISSVRSTFVTPRLAKELLGEAGLLVHILPMLGAEVDEAVSRLWSVVRPGVAEAAFRSVLRGENLAVMARNRLQLWMMVNAADDLLVVAEHLPYMTTTHVTRVCVRRLVENSVVTSGDVSVSRDDTDRILHLCELLAGEMFHRGSHRLRVALVDTREAAAGAVSSVLDEQVADRDDRELSRCLEWFRVHCPMLRVSRDGCEFSHDMLYCTFLAYLVFESCNRGSIPETWDKMSRLFGHVGPWSAECVGTNLGRSGENMYATISSEPVVLDMLRELFNATNDVERSRLAKVCLFELVANSGTRKQSSKDGIVFTDSLIFRRGVAGGNAATVLNYTCVSQFVGAPLAGSYLVGADLTRADMTGASWNASVFEACTLTQANLSCSCLDDCIFHDVHLDAVPPVEISTTGLRQSVFSLAVSGDLMAVGLYGRVTLWRIRADGSHICLSNQKLDDGTKTTSLSFSSVDPENGFVLLVAGTNNNSGLHRGVSTYAWALPDGVATGEIAVPDPTRLPPILHSFSDLKKVEVAPDCFGPQLTSSSVGTTIRSFILTECGKLLKFSVGAVDVSYIRVEKLEDGSLRVSRACTTSVDLTSMLVSSLDHPLSNSVYSSSIVMTDKGLLLAIGTNDPRNGVGIVRICAMRDSVLCVVACKLFPIDTSPQQTKQKRDESRVRSMDFVPCSSGDLRLFVGTRAGTIVCWDVETLLEWDPVVSKSEMVGDIVCPAPFPISNNPPRPIRVVKDQNGRLACITHCTFGGVMYIATTGDDGKSRLWDATTGLSVGPAVTCFTASTGTAFCFDGKFVAVGGASRFVQFRSIEQHVGPLTLHTSAIKHMFASNKNGDDEYRLFSSGSDGTSHVWNTGVEGPMIAGSKSACPVSVRDNTLAVSPDFMPHGLSATSDGTNSPVLLRLGTLSGQKSCFFTLDELVAAGIGGIPLEDILNRHGVGVGVWDEEVKGADDDGDDDEEKEGEARCGRSTLPVGQPIEESSLHVSGVFFSPVFNARTMCEDAVARKGVILAVAMDRLIPQETSSGCRGVTTVDLFEVTYHEGILRARELGGRLDLGTQCFKISFSDVHDSLSAHSSGMWIVFGTSRAFIAEGWLPFLKGDSEGSPTYHPLALVGGLNRMRIACSCTDPVTVVEVDTIEKHGDKTIVLFAATNKNDTIITTLPLVAFAPAAPTDDSFPGPRRFQEPLHREERVEIVQGWHLDKDVITGDIAAAHIIRGVSTPTGDVGMVLVSLSGMSGRLLRVDIPDLGTIQTTNGALEESKVMVVYRAPLLDKTPVFYITAMWTWRDGVFDGTVLVGCSDGSIRHLDIRRSVVASPTASCIFRRNVKWSTPSGNSKLLMAESSGRHTVTIEPKETEHSVRTLFRFAGAGDSKL